MYKRNSRVDKKISGGKGVWGCVGIRIRYFSRKIFSKIDSISTYISIANLTNLSLSHSSYQSTILIVFLIVYDWR